MRVNRVDHSPLGKAERTPTGGYRLPAVLTRPGVFLYHDASGRPIREYRPPEEVHDPASVASLGDAAVTIGHPRAGVTAGNWGELSVGYVRADTLGKDERTQGVASSIVVARGDAVAGVERTDAEALRDISGGYSVEIDETPGTTPDGEPYDRVQRRIRYNHVALLRRGDGRQGTSVGLRLDGAGHALTEENPIMKIKVKVGDTVHECEAGSQEHLDLQGRADALNAKALADANTALQTEKARADAAAAETAKLKARLDSIDAEAAKAARAKLEAEARKVLGAEAKFDGKSDREVMAAVVVKTDSKFSDDGTPERAAYVQARYDLALAALPATNSTQTLVSGFRAPERPARADGTEATVENDPMAYADKLRADGKKLHERKGELHL